MHEFSFWSSALEQIQRHTFNPISYAIKFWLSSNKRITLPQRAWWVSTRDTDFTGEVSYPSTPAEAFQQSSEGCYNSVQMTAARKQGRITQVPYVQVTPVNTFWDIGRCGCISGWGVHMEAADAFRQFPQAGSQGMFVGRAVPTTVVRRRVGSWMR